MSATGLDVFDRTLQTTHIWLGEIAAFLDTDRQTAWKALSVVLHKLRDRMPVALSAHLSAELPLLVRGVYYDQFEPTKQPTDWTPEDFTREVASGMSDARPVVPRAAIAAVFSVLSRHVPQGQIAKARAALPADMRAFWVAAENEAERRGTGGGPASCSTQAQEMTMKVSEAMTKEVRVASPDETIQDAARMMASLDAGALPVGEKDHLVGMITDRDIAIRGIAMGKGPEARVRDVMSSDVKYCFADQDLNEVTLNMADIQVRRLPVVDRDKRLVGILSLGDIAVSRNGKGAGVALRGISRPGGEHSQATG